MLKKVQQKLNTYYNQNGNLKVTYRWET